MECFRFKTINSKIMLFMSTMLLSSGLFAGTIKGIVRDSEKGEPVEGAVVIARSGANEATAFTQKDGSFELKDLAAGAYTFTASYAGVSDVKEMTVGADDSLEIKMNIAMSKAKAEVYTISVTGSLLGATAKDTPIPLYGVDRETTLKKGDPTILEQVKSMPIGGPVFGDANPFNPDAQFRPGTGTINVRGLGAQRTLVLLNGRRFSANDRNAADTNLLPSSVIGRVEILKDGGAATYGSDAIAGVANFFTRQDINGLELSADYRIINNSAGEANVSGAWGRVWDGGNFLVSAGYQFRGELNSTNRDWAVQPRTVNPEPWSPYGNPGLWVILGQPAPTAAPIPIGARLDANCETLGGTLGAVGNNPFCYYPYTPYYNLVNEQHQVQLYGEFNTKVGSRSKLHIDALYAMTNNPKLTVTPSFPSLTGPTGPGTRYFVPANNPGFADFLAQTGGAATLPLAPIGALGVLFQPFSLGGNPSGEGNFGGRRAYNKNEEIRISGELSGPVGLLDMNYRLGANYVIEEQLGSFPDTLVARLQAALNGLGGPNCTGTTPGANGCQWLNPFSNSIPRGSVNGATNPGFVPGNVVDPALARWIEDYNREFRLRTDMGVFDAIVDGKIPLKLPGGEPTWALGGQYRRTTSYVTIDNPLMNSLANPCPTPGDTTCTVHTGPYVFSGQFTPSYIAQGVYALFGEIDVPLFDAWKSQFSLRFEDYGGLTGSTVNPEFRTKWQVFDVFAVRGSIGTSFRGPTPTNVINGLNNTQLAPVSAAGGGFKANDIFGNPSVAPEKAFSFNFGSIFQFRNFTTTIDYWFYKLDNQLAITTPDQIANAVATGPGTPVNCARPMRDRVTFDRNNTCDATTTGLNISRVRSDTVNGPSLTTMGLDIDADYLIEHVFGGSLNLGAYASVMIKYQQDDFVLNGVTIQQAYDAVGYTNYDRLPGTIPRWRGQFFVNYNNGWHNVRVTTNYTDGATDNRGPTVVQTGPTGGITPQTVCTVANATAGSAPNCQITNYGVTLPGFVSLDVTYQLSLPWDMVVSLSAFNLIGMNPPGARLQFGYDPFIGNPLGRTFKFAITQKF